MADSYFEATTQSYHYTDSPTTSGWTPSVTSGYSSNIGTALISTVVIAVSALLVGLCVYLRVRIWSRRLNTLTGTGFGGTIIRQAPTLTVVNTTTTTGNMQQVPPAYSPLPSGPPQPPTSHSNVNGNVYNAGYDQPRAPTNFQTLPTHLPPYAECV